MTKSHQDAFHPKNQWNMTSFREPIVGPASGKLKAKLSSTSGLLMFKFHKPYNEETISCLDKEMEANRVLHCTCWATQNFQIKMAFLNCHFQGQQINAAQRIQCYYRGYMVRRQYLRARDNIVKLQAWFRMMRVRKQLRQLYAAAIIVQKHWRINTAHRSLHSLKFEWTLKNQAAILIQANIRGWFVRQTCWQLLTENRNKRHEQHYLCKVEAAQKIQAAIRSFLFRKSCQARSKLSSSSKHNQFDHSHHAYLEKGMNRALHSNMTDELEAARVSSLSFDITATITILQSHFRGYQARKSIRSQRIAAKLIQQYWRQHRCIRSQETGYDLRSLEDTKVERKWQASGPLMSFTHEKPAIGLCSNECQEQHWNEKRYFETNGMQNLNLCNIPSKPYCHHKLIRIKQNEEKLQKFAQIFLLHHHIVAAQQRAQCAPPFPPRIANSDCNSAAANGKIEDVDVSSFQGREKFQSVLQSTSSVLGNRATEVVLDVAALLRYLEQSYTTSTAMSMASADSTDLLSVTGIILDEDCHSCMLDAKKSRLVLFQNLHHPESASTRSIVIRKMGIPDVRTLVAVIVAVVLYVHTLCRRFLFGPSKPNGIRLPLLSKW